MMISRFKVAAIGVVMMSAFAVSSASASAGEADVIAAKAVREATGTFRFDVTIAHPDTGWEHYADAFEILDMNGNVLGTRVLAHPHVDEQPFTRSLLGVVIPNGVIKVTIRAHDSVHEFGGREIVLTLPLK